MFDIGFTELLVCLIVALVVIGPEQLPGAVRTAGLWIGRLKRSLRDTRNEIERQIGADDIRRQLHNEEVMQNLEEARLRIEKTMREAEAEAVANINETPTPSAKDYGPPEELPDHAHTEDPVASPAVTASEEPTATPAAQPQSGTGH